jgi:hypothetical protein
MRLATELGHEFYESSMPARPIAYLRGDWLRPAPRPAAGCRLRKKLSDVPPPADVPRPIEEPTSKAPAARRIIPFDSVLLDPDDASPFDLVLTTEQADNTLLPGKRIAVSIDNPTRKNVWVEAVHTDAKGHKTVLAPPELLRAGQKQRFPAEDGPGGAVASNGGRELVTLFVFPEIFERVKVLRDYGLVDRFVHPFYALDDKCQLRYPEADFSVACGQWQRGCGQEVRQRLGIFRWQTSGGEHLDRKTPPSLVPRRTCAVLSPSA